jgi:hypothetical protein
VPWDRTYAYAVGRNAPLALEEAAHGRLAARQVRQRLEQRHDAQRAVVVAERGVAAAHHVGLALQQPSPIPPHLHTRRTNTSMTHIQTRL